MPCWELTVHPSPCNLEDFRIFHRLAYVPANNRWKCSQAISHGTRFPSELLLTSPNNDTCSDEPKFSRGVFPRETSQVKNCAKRLYSKTLQYTWKKLRGTVWWLIYIYIYTYNIYIYISIGFMGRTVDLPAWMVDLYLQLWRLKWHRGFLRFWRHLDTLCSFCSGIENQQCTTLSTKINHVKHICKIAEVIFPYIFPVTPHTEILRCHANGLHGCKCYLMQTSRVIPSFCATCQPDFRLQLWPKCLQLPGLMTAPKSEEQGRPRLFESTGLIFLSTLSP